MSFSQPRTVVRTRRRPGLDLARGIAVCSMIVAHTSPWPIDLPAEYLTAPLFATLVGASLHLAWTTSAARGTPPSIFFAENAVRGLVLLLLGEALQRTYAGIDIVLQTLGLLTIVLAPVVVALRSARAALIGAAALLALSPFVMTATRDWLAAHPGLRPDVQALAHWLVAGAHYRVLSFAAYGLVGIAIARWVARDRFRGAAGLVVAFACAGLALVVYGIGRDAGAAQPYAGDHLELLGSSAFAAAVVLACAGLLSDDRPGWWAPLVATGRLALTAYTVQILLLRLLQELRGPGFGDDQAWVLALTLLVCVGGCWAWRRTRLPGPLEALLRFPRAAYR